MVRSKSTTPDAAGPSKRALRVGEELRHALAAILARGGLRDPELAGHSITVTEVRMSPDLSRASAYVMPLGGRDVAATVKALARAAPYLRGALARAVRLRRAPELAFFADRSFDYASRIDAALRRPEVERDISGPAAGEDEPPA